MAVFGSLTTSLIFPYFRYMASFWINHLLERLEMVFWRVFTLISIKGPKSRNNSNGEDGYFKDSRMKHALKCFNSNRKNLLFPFFHFKKIIKNYSNIFFFDDMFQTFFFEYALKVSEWILIFPNVLKYFIFCLCDMSKKTLLLIYFRTK